MLPVIVQAAWLAGTAFMVNLATYLAELAVRHKCTAVYRDCLESLALRAKCHHFSRPGIVSQLVLGNTFCTLP